VLVDALDAPFRRSYLGRVDLGRLDFSVDAARALHAALLQPLEPYLHSAKHLFIVPDGSLHRLPFAAFAAALPSPTRAPGPIFEVDRYDIAYLPASQYLPANRYPTLTDPRIVAVGFDAPGWQHELDGITSVWGSSRTTIIAQERASETAIRALSHPDILHFVAHAEANHRDPLASHLRLAADSTNDGYLHFTEIAESGPAADLVILSACESTGGKVFRGEGAMSLARAFLESGSRAVVASLWPVGPSAAEFMREFHRGLATGSSPRAALAAAQRAMRKDPETANPFHWAGFVLIEGSGRGR
jgi:CHAT domain-containing protein